MRDKRPPKGLNSAHCNLNAAATCSSNGTWLESPKVCDDWPIVPRYFLDPSWTTVAFVRDPWYRSLSMYHDQMHRGHLPKRWKFDSQKNFSNFIVSYSNIRGHWSEGFKHTGDAVNYCGLRYVKYDVYVDVDQIARGLKELITRRPDLSRAVETGWENCTKNHSPSLVEGESSQSHQMKSAANNVEEKLRMYDSILCTPEIANQVFVRYQADYQIFKHALNYSVHTCLV